MDQDIDMDIRNDEETTNSTLLSQQDRSTIPVPVPDSIFPSQTAFSVFAVFLILAIICLVIMIVYFVKKLKLVRSQNRKMDRDIDMDMDMDIGRFIKRNIRQQFPAQNSELDRDIDMDKRFIKRNIRQQYPAQNSELDRDIDMEKRNDEETLSLTLQSQQAPSGESDPLIQQHSEELSGNITQAALEWINEVKIPTRGIENADDTAAGNQIRLKQIVRNPDPGTSDTAPGTKKTTELPSGESNPPKQQELLEDITLASLKWIDGEKIPIQVKQGWTHIEGTDIFYDQASRYRKGSKVFNAIRISGAKDQETVVKFVTDFNHGDREFISKFKREIETINENVVKYLQSGDCKYKTKDAFFILMEKCDRKTLFERIKEGKMPYSKRAKTVKCVAQGLQHLKRGNILHRDLKPQNILYKGDVGVISYFGLSEKISPFDKSHTHQSLEFVETLGWGAPEAYSDNAKSSYAADIYSAGLLFYFTLTNGKHPYGDTPIYRQTNINDDRNCNLKPLYDTPDGIVAYDLISLMLSRDPKDRPTVEEVLKHPFFWDLEKKKKFYYDICSIIKFHSEKKIESRIFSSQPAKQSEKVKTEKKKLVPPPDYYRNKVDTEKINWIKKLTLTEAEKTNIKLNFSRRKSPNITVQKDVMMDFAKKHPDSVTSMVCFIRNRFEHSGEDKRKGKIDLTDEKLWEFFNSRYPYLFIYTYYASKEYNETKPASNPINLDNYFKRKDEKNTKNDEATADLNECIQTKLNRKVHDFLQELLTNTDNPVREKEICSILRDINSTTKPLDTPQDQLSATEQLFKDDEKSEEYTTELGVKRSRREVSNLTTLDKTLQSSETGGKLVRKASQDVLPSSETPSCQSKPVKTHYSDCTLSNDELSAIKNMISFNSEIDKIEFCDCKIGKDYCTPGKNQKNTAKCKISKLIISYTDHFKEFSGFFYSTFGGCEIKSFCLVYADLDDRDVEKLYSFLVMNQVKGIENLDISYSKRIGPDGFEHIGNIIAEQGIKTLKAINCGLEKMKLLRLFAGLKNVNLRELDIGYNNNLAEGGFKMLAKLVASRGIEVLKLRGCQLAEKTIQVFNNKLEETDENVLLNELDVSYNPEINPAGCKFLGLIIKKFGITTLNLAGCRISEEHLTSLMSINNIELHALNLSDNSYPGNIMVEIAKIVSEFKIQELDISDCMFSVSELSIFRTNLKETKLQKLHLGDESCKLGMEYIEEVCQLLQTVNEMLYLRFHRLDDSCRRRLNEQSEKLSVSIQMGDEPEAVSD